MKGFLIRKEVNSSPFTNDISFYVEYSEETSEDYWNYQINLGKSWSTSVYKTIIYIVSLNKKNILKI